MDENISQINQETVPSFENARRFLKTLRTEVNLVDQTWIEAVREKGAEAVVYSLGSGSSNVETEAIQYLLPNSIKFAVDPDKTGEIMAKHYGFKFLAKSAGDPEIYSLNGQNLRPDLVIIRNLQPEPKEYYEMWTGAIRLAWERMKPGGILYLTASSSDRQKDSEIVVKALNRPQGEIFDGWKINANPLGPGAFPDQIVLCLQKSAIQKDEVE